MVNKMHFIFGPKVPKLGNLGIEILKINIKFEISIPLLVYIPYFRSFGALFENFKYSKNSRVPGSGFSRGPGSGFS